MWKQIYKSLKQLLLLTERTRENRSEIRDLRRELHDLASTVERLAHELRRFQERESHEREKLMLRLENKLLHFERQFPEAKQEDEDDAA